MNSTMQKMPKSTRGRLPRELRLPAVLAAVVVGLLILRAVLAALTPAPGTVEAPPEDVPDAQLFHVLHVIGRQVFTVL